MNDYLKILEQYKSIKEFDDLKNEVEKLREYYHTGQYEKMRQHIQFLVLKYPNDAAAWNCIHPVPPQTPEQRYLNTESFLQAKFQAILIEKGLTDKNY